ncbi:hypothetical protein [Commensalibacter melissae]|uniref:hypothetical protein n=1 Tax=Commensalibacter melissae TaxID=2070537 RepID=UPI001313E72B|nr:hypothetical protein [Commensalibacter melissae]
MKDVAGHEICKGIYSRHDQQYRAPPLTRAMVTMFLVPPVFHWCHPRSFHLFPPACLAA